MVRVELNMANAKHVDALISHEQAEVLRPAPGDEFFVRARKWCEYQ